MAEIDAYHVPADYSELFRVYYGYIKGYLRKLGIPAQDCPDAASYVLERMVARDFLAFFDPGYQSERNGKPVQVRFRNLLNASVEHYARGLRDSQRRRASSEILLCDKEYAGDGDQSWRWLDVFGPATWDEYGGLDEEALVSRLRNHLATVPRRSTRDLCDLTALFDELVQQVRGGSDSIDYGRVQRRFGIGSTAAHSWVVYLREVLRDVIPRGEDGWGQLRTA